MYKHNFISLFKTLNYLPTKKYYVGILIMSSNIKNNLYHRESCHINHKCIMYSIILNIYKMIIILYFV